MREEDFEEERKRKMRNSQTKLVVGLKEENKT